MKQITTDARNEPKEVFIKTRIVIKGGGAGEEWGYGGSWHCGEFEKRWIRVIIFGNFDVI